MKDDLLAIQYLLDWKLPVDHDRVNLVPLNRVGVVGWRVDNQGTPGLRFLEDGLDDVLERLRDPSVRCCHVVELDVLETGEPSTVIAYQVRGTEGMQNKYCLLRGVRCEPRLENAEPDYR